MKDRKAVKIDKLNFGKIKYFSQKRDHELYTSLSTL